MISSLSDCYGWRTGFIFMQHGRTERYQHQPLILYRKHLVQWTVLQISSNMLIDNNIIFSSLPAVCLCLSNLTAPQPLLFLSVRACCLSFYPSLALLTVPSTPSFCLSVLPWLCWQLLGLMPSQCSAPSWPLERRLHSLSRWTGNHSFSHFFFLKSLFYPFPHLLRHSVSLFLSSVSISIFLHSWPSCCWETVRKQDWEENR